MENVSNSWHTKENMESVVDSLDALLADLQTNLNKPSPLNHTTTQQTTVITNNQPVTKTEITKTVVTNHNHHHDDRTNGDCNQHVYQNEEQRRSNLGQGNVPNGYHHTSTSSPTYQNIPSNAQQMFRHEMREEVRTETHSSGPDPSPPKKTISNNLSELDTLLHDLNTTKQNSFSKDSTVVNGTRPSVDSLLDELNSVGHRETTYEKRTTHQETRPVSYTNKVTHVSASNATKELDDLMESLSDFKINASSLQSQVDNTAYAKPIPKRRSPSPPPPPKPVTPPAPKPSPPNQLDSMLGTLTSHMTEQGINTSQKGCCVACDKPIVGQVITALGKTWHPEHFTCTHCKEELGTRNFFERDGKPYCEPDYHNLFSPKCAYCGGPILDKCVTAMNKTWHPEHFFCAQCGNPFGEEGFHEKNGKPYCKEDYFNMFAPKCGGCNNPIMENYISALNGQWHPECFVCRDCNQPFNGGSFFDHEGMPYCETHYHAKRGSLCAACNKPITGRCITAMFKKFHPEHFLCAFCLQQLNKGTFKEQNNKPYCHPCFEKLYG